MKQMNFDEFMEEDYEDINNSHRTRDFYEDTYRESDKRNKDDLRDLQRQRHYKDARDRQMHEEQLAYEKECARREYARKKAQQRKKEDFYKERYEKDPYYEKYPNKRIPEYDNRNYYERNRDLSYNPSRYNDLPYDANHKMFGGTDNNKLIIKIGIAVLVLLAVTFLFKGNKAWSALSLLVLILIVMNGMRGKKTKM